MDKLKLCPFCGKVPELEFTGLTYQMGCFNRECNVQPKTDYYNTPQEAIEVWNTRKGEENDD